MPYQTLELNARPPLAIITLSNGASGNLVGPTLIGELRSALESAAADHAVRAAVITGSDDVFSLGWDRQFVEAIEQGALEDNSSAPLGSTFQFLVESPLPVIATISGDAISAGLELALACDLRIAVADARLGLPDVSLGRIPMAGGTQRLTRLTGHGRAVELILTGRMLSATEALTWGLLSNVCERGELLEKAAELGETMAGRGPLAVQLAKEAVHSGIDMPLSQALRYETDLTVLLQTTADREEGVRAFVEKRKPSFEGR
jgi:enoyl-CoA hydratase